MEPHAKGTEDMGRLRAFFLNGPNFELRETTYITMKDTGIYQTKMVRDVVEGLQEVFNKE